jgi:hypothetical protein
MTCFNFYHFEFTEKNKNIAFQRVSNNFINFAGGTDWIIDSYIPHHNHHYAGQKMEKQR